MPWYAWVTVAVIAVSALICVATIGEERKPLTAKAAVVALILNGLIVWCIVALAYRG